ncbi:uncharacterized protein [Spinacia oleracea]|uniref:DUF1985 domain-containing protein n=1 Tax=Spinacia oleracea TaxID=3562 RepID=A0ABM3R1G2_SPIOL|nr:uncharacterized protein LOC110802443 [Spinacia oleracea]
MTRTSANDMENDMEPEYEGSENVSSSEDDDEDDEDVNITQLSEHSDSDRDDDNNPSKKRNTQNQVIQKTETPVRKAGKEEDQKKKYIKKTGVRVNHTAFMEWVPKLTENQRNTIQEIGLGPLLTVNLPQNDQAFCYWLLDQYEEYSSTLYLPRGNTIRLEVDDVHIVYGLQMGGRRIIESKFDHDTEEYKNFLTEWRRTWNIRTGAPSVSKIIKRYTTEVGFIGCEPHDNFMTDFLVVAVNIFTKSSQSTQANYRFLLSMMDRNEIRNLDWCEYVLLSLDATVEDWKQNKTTFFKGPLPFLQLFYFDRVMKKRVEQPRTFPLISTWTKKMVKDRIIEERKGYGLGRILDKIELPEPEVPQENVPHNVQGEAVQQLVQQPVQQNVQGEAHNVQQQENPKDFMMDFIMLMNN